MNARNTHSSAIVATAVALMAALVSGCGAVSSIKNDDVANPLTPEQSKAQVIDAANEIVSTLKLSVIEPAFWHASCNDQGDAPFRGQMMIGYPLAASFEASDAEVAQMVQHLQSTGWTTDPDFHTHGTALKKNEVTAVFGPQNASDPTRSLELFGECRDVTTTKDTKGSTTIVDLAAQ
ncbi:MAG: hypothetical protein QOE74_5766 [Mycobacterium sp.]|jgi:hypothetical protein|nr:hypothetical protein [Mycobacterium sp.]MDT5316746.1 hypothetical protein [Mycobacterium sp.]